MAVRGWPASGCHRGHVTAPTVPTASPAAAGAPDRDGERPSPRRRLRLPTVRRPRLNLVAPALLGVAAACWAAVIGLALAVVPMLVAWIASSTTGLTWQESIRIGGTVWSVAQTTPVVVGGITYSLVPWGLALVAVLLVAHGGRWALQRCPDGRPTLVLVGSAAFAYALIAVLVAVLSGPDAVDVSPVGAALHALGVALVGLVVALAREGRFGRMPIPALVGVVMRAALAGAAALVGIGALAAALVLAAHVDDAATMLADLHAGIGGGLVILVLGLGYLPVLAVWATSYLLGAGVVLGPAVTVSPFIAVTPSTLLPPFPLLAAVPATASPLAWGLPIAGVVAGLTVGAVVARGAREESRLTRAGLAAAAAAVAGVVLAALALLSTGSMGDLRLAHLGPAPVAVGVLATILLGAGAAPVAVLRPAPSRAGLRVADPPTAPHSDSLGTASADRPERAGRSEVDSHD